MRRLCVKANTPSGLESISTSALARRPMAACHANGLAQCQPASGAASQRRLSDAVSSCSSHPQPRLGDCFHSVCVCVSAVAPASNTSESAGKPRDCSRVCGEFHARANLPLSTVCVNDTALSRRNVHLAVAGNGMKRNATLRAPQGHELLLFGRGAHGKKRRGAWTVRKACRAAGRAIRPSDPT